MIDALVPVLGRPQNLGSLYRSFRDTSGPMDEMHFLVSPGAHEDLEAALQTGAQTHIVDWAPGPGDYARKMNYGYKISERPFLFLGATDIEFRAGWMEAALRKAERACVVATNDLANAQVRRGQFGTHCLVRRAYVKEQGASYGGPGTFLHTGYDHNFVDRELCGMATARGVYAFARDSHVPHRHPLWKTAEWDETYRKGLKRFQRDRALFLQRASLWDYAGLTPGERQAARGGRRRDILKSR
jgi:hypothetical protein